MKPLVLPAWAKVIPSVLVDKGKVSVNIEVNADEAYPEWFALLASDQFPPSSGDPSRMVDSENPDQYWVEVAYQCTKLDIQAALAGTEYDPRVAKKFAHIRIRGSVVDAVNKWNLKNFPKGFGAELATQGKHAREHYKRVRGSLPF